VHGAFEVEVDLQLRRATVVVPGNASNANTTRETVEFVPIVGRLLVPTLSNESLVALTINGKVVAELDVLNDGAGHHWVERVGPGRHVLEWDVAPASDVINPRARVVGAVQTGSAAATGNSVATAPPQYDGKFVRRDDKTKGDWLSSGAYGTQGYHLFHFCGAQTATCATTTETNTLLVGCTAGSTINKVLFADFGVIGGDCDAGLSSDPNCTSHNLSAIVASQCVGMQLGCVRPWSDACGLCSDCDRGGVGAAAVVAGTCAGTNSDRKVYCWLMFIAD
jgi:hypothetical protein